MHAQTAVNAAGECDVRAAPSTDIEGVWIGPPRLVPIGGPHAQVDLRSLPNGYAIDFHVPGGRARNAHERRLVPEPLFDRRRYQLTVTLHRRELLGMGQQQIEKVA